MDLLPESRKRLRAGQGSRTMASMGKELKEDDNCKPEISAVEDQASIEVPVREPSSDELDAILAVEFEVSTEVGDDEDILSPDDADGDVCGESKVIEPIIFSPTIGADDKYAQILRRVIAGLVDWAKANDLSKMSKDDRAMTFGYWTLSRLPIDFAVELFLPGIPSRVRALFENGDMVQKGFYVTSNCRR